MSAMNKPPSSVQPPAAVTGARERLALSRAKLAGWVDQDRAALAVAPGTGWDALAAWPAINRWRTHPLAVLALGAVARAWQRPAVGDPTPPLQVLVLGTAAAALRRHPKTVLATVALAVALVLGARWRQRAQPSAQKS